MSDNALKIPDEWRGTGPCYRDHKEGGAGSAIALPLF